ncbi:MAG TPA: uroporphyrinogen-III C-methyltransferase [Thermomicrobiales bacterium]|nr:uroporphyrinogen-III C-methyltransferase [Thermomicrobiales bacterium]
MTGVGRVSLVGAGPGDPELITVRGLERIRSSDVLVYDRLVAQELVDAAPLHAERVFAGKSAGCAALDQRAIEDLLIDRARAGRHVVRLKGGDPFVFGRGGEEVAALVSAGVAVEVVPGVTSAVGVPTRAGIPVTHRRLSSSVTIVTGHEDPTKDHAAVDWNWLAATRGTVVILMGLRHLATICARLIAGGRSPGTPAAAIANGTCPNERVVTAPLSDLAAAVVAADLDAPALVVVGEVVGLRELLSPVARVEPLPALLSWLAPV